MATPLDFGPRLDGFSQNPGKSRSEIINTSLAHRKAEHTYSGVDIQAVMYIPILIRGQDSKQTPLVKTFGELQTISISSTRSVSPVRVLGAANPIAHTRGGRTFAGSMVFTVINRTVFNDLYRPDVAESMVNASTSLFIDQLPPFSILITASNELGGMSYQLINGITLMNYGTAYSIDDLYTEETYTYVATDVTPMLPIDSPFTPRGPGVSFKTVTQILEEELKRSYGKDFAEYERMLNSNPPALAAVDEAALDNYFNWGMEPTRGKYTVKSSRYVRQGARV